MDWFLFVGLSLLKDVNSTLKLLNCRWSPGRLFIFRDFALH
jgi:hypothetical protein